ncbi:hypothetical protein PAMP_021799 [Pampus punctatissimus]
MMTKPLLLLIALTLCCCFASLDGRAIPGCHCIGHSSNQVSDKMIKKFEVIPISGRCRRTEIIVTRWNNTKICIDPNAVWLDELMQTLKKKSMTAN